MSEHTILVIDDSSTIRRLVDSELSAAGYRVVLAANAEEGLNQATQERPNLILLDHQLPGTTGSDVCCYLLDSAELSQIPVVVSSTLRKRAYAEYMDSPNVVDMLPKPYTSELLITTVENAINTAAMVVQSQTVGSAVPEIINELSEAALSGNFDCFGLREVIDLLNNGAKCGVLEVETQSCRVWIYVDKGRVQAVTAAGIDPAQVSSCLPQSLAELAPVMNFTVAGRRCSEIDGLVQLLDNKVLDPRLLRKLLRLQAAVLLRICFTTPLKSFRFENQTTVPPLFRKLPLDISLLALLVEGSLNCEASQLPEVQAAEAFKRRAIRGQNLDRAGLSSQHMKLMGLLSEALTIDQIAQRLEWESDEVRRVLHGFELAELIERRPIDLTLSVIAVASDPQQLRWLHQTFESHRDQVNGKVVKDWLAAGLLLRRNQPDVLLVCLDNDLAVAQVHKLYSGPNSAIANSRLIGLAASSQPSDLQSIESHLECVLELPCPEDALLQTILAGSPDQPTPSNPESDRALTTVPPPAAPQENPNSEENHAKCF